MRKFLGTAALCLVIGTAAADPVKMTGAEITEALTGNAVKGVWGETAYTSTFAKDGTTVYTAEGKAPDTGTWRVKGDQYCSVWAGSGEDCYDLERDGDTIIWIVPATGKRYPSTLMKQ
jgi:hypothetical protein